MSFLSTIKQPAINGYAKSKILPSITGAQAILESARGTSELAKHANNLFGIKGTWNGQSYTVKTSEYINGQWKKVNAAFRNYPNYQDSIDDHGAFFTSTPWRTKNYADVLNAKNYKAQAKALQSSGYATDPQYANKLINLIESEGLAAWDKNIKQGSGKVSKTIALDIGHGTNTFPPGKGVYKNGKGYAEFSFNNKLGKKVKALLEHNGFKVIMAQPFDSKDVSLINRTNYYDSKKPDLGFSLHANAGAASAGGRCAFYWYTSKQGKDFATKIINNMKKMGYGLHGTGLHASQYNSWTNLHVIRECTTFPMVLVEHGFMTNSLDFPLIFGNKQSQYIEDMAECDVKAVCQYFGVTFKKLDQKSSSGSGSSKPDKDGWRTNDYGTQWKPLKGVWINGNQEITKRRGAPKLNAKTSGQMPKGQRLDYREIARSDGHIWLLDLKSDQWVPVKTWDSKTGKVGPDWGTWR